MPALLLALWNDVIAIMTSCNDVMQAPLHYGSSCARTDRIPRLLFTSTNVHYVRLGGRLYPSHLMLAVPVAAAVVCVGLTIVGGL